MKGTIVSIWDNPEMSTGGEYVKFEKIGDTVTGRITVLGVKRWDDGSISPQLTLDTADGERTLTAGQVRLKAALVEQRPEEGDTITVTLSNVEKRAGGKTLKHFDVVVARAGAAPAATPAAAPAAGGVDLSALPPEAQAAMRAANLLG